MLRKLVTFGFFTALLAPACLSAQAEVTANAGYLSQYYYRGILQKTSSANGGMDVAVSDFSAGTWVADVGDGSEVDLYASVGIPLGENGSVSVGGTGYFYTGQFDKTYLEGNLGIGFGALSVDGALGTHRTTPDEKYMFLSVTATAPNGLFATVGSSAYNATMSDAIKNVFKHDMAYWYLEAGYGFSAADLDFTFSGIWNNANASGEYNGDTPPAPTNELTWVLGVSKTFTIPTS